MRKISDNIKYFSGENPFKDSQARTFSDDKVLSEFFPISNYWSLFNEQHEILIGTRGSGKTILLKMMRYSLLKKVNDPKAKELVKAKKFIGLYIPMNLEFLGNFNYQEIPDEIKLPYFQFAFNCLLSQSLIYELSSILEDIDDVLIRSKRNIELTKKISHIWFPDITSNSLSELNDISNEINNLYYNHGVHVPLSNVPQVFIKTIGTPLQSILESISQVLGWSSHPSWLLCIDEAEFLLPLFQKCINTLFRSDSKRLVVKMATLPFVHSTKETLTPGVYAEADGNDFNYRLIDMKYDSGDFVQVTNNLCGRRIAERINTIPIHSTLEDFLGKIGGDDLIDYYRCEVGDEKATRGAIEEKIVEDFSDKRKTTAIKEEIGSAVNRKKVYDKFSTVFYYREMHRLSTQGNRVPGWYAGATMVRRVSQGNPRRYIQIMNDLFEKARKTNLGPKTQHEVLYKYAERICDSTKGLPEHGPEAAELLDKISEMLKARVHDGALIEAGNTFHLDLGNYGDDVNKLWLYLAVQYLRLVIDNSSIVNGIDKDTEYTLSNIYCAKYWVPMRAGGYPKIKMGMKEAAVGKVRKKSTSESDVYQLTIFDSESLNADPK